MIKELEMLLVSVNVDFFIHSYIKQRQRNCNEVDGWVKQVKACKTGEKVVGFFFLSSVVQVKDGLMR